MNGGSTPRLWKTPRSSNSNSSIKKRNLERERSRLERIRNAKHPIKKYREIQNELELLKDAVILEPGFSERRLQVRDDLLKSQQSHQTIQADLKHIADELEAITFNQALIDQSAEIEWLYQEVGAYKKSVSDCPKINSLREAAENEARRLLKELTARCLFGGCR